MNSKKKEYGLFPFREWHKTLTESEKQRKHFRRETYDWNKSKHLLPKFLNRGHKAWSVGVVRK